VQDEHEADDRLQAGAEIIDFKNPQKVRSARWTRTLSRARCSA
jgi:hypothetical protein